MLVDAARRRLLLDRRQTFYARLSQHGSDNRRDRDQNEHGVQHARIQQTLARGVDRLISDEGRGQRCRNLREGEGCDQAPLRALIAPRAPHDLCCQPLLEIRSTRISPSTSQLLPRMVSHSTCRSIRNPVTRKKAGMKKMSPKDFNRSRPGVALAAVLAASPAMKAPRIDSRPSSSAEAAASAAMATSSQKLASSVRPNLPNSQRPNF